MTSAEEQTGTSGPTTDKVVQPVAAGDRGRDARAGGFGSAGRRRANLAGGRPSQDTLTTQGWAVGQIPAETGLPDPGVLLALSGLSG